MTRRRLNRFKYEPPTPEEVNKYMHVYTGWQLIHAIDDVVAITSENIFCDMHPLHLDLGCGRGEFIIQEAETHADTNYIGVDRHLKSLEDAIHSASQKGLENVRFIKGDLRCILRAVPNSSISAVYLLFPSPNVKPKYKHKDYLQAPFIEKVHQILVPGGPVCLVTDHEEYFHLKQELFQESGLFAIVMVADGFEGGITWFQKIWETHGLKTWRAEYVKKDY